MEIVVVEVRPSRTVFFLKTPMCLFFCLLSSCEVCLLLFSICHVSHRHVLSSFDRLLHLMSTLRLAQVFETQH